MTLDARRKRENIIHVVKIEKGIDEVDLISPHIRGAPRRSNRRQLREQIVQNYTQRSDFFSDKMVNNWNSLPELIANTPKSEKQIG